MEGKDEKWFANLQYAWYPDEEHLRFGELLLCHGSSKHLLFNTTEGYNSDKECETLGHDDSIYIHSWKTQRRIVARTQQFDYISIPLEYPIEFKTLPDGPTNTLKILVREGPELPMRVRTASTETSFYIDEYNKRIETPLKEFDLLHIYDESYVIGNIMLNGNIRPEQVVIPLYLPIRGVIGFGLKNHPHEAWVQLMEYFKGFVESQKINTDSLLDNTEINVYSRELDLDNIGDYAMVKPESYLKIDMSNLPPVSDIPPPRPPRYRREAPRQGFARKIKEKFHSLRLKPPQLHKGKQLSLPDDRPLPLLPTDVDTDKSKSDRGNADDVKGQGCDYDYVTMSRWDMDGKSSGSKQKTPEAHPVKSTTFLKHLAKLNTENASQCIVRPVQKTPGSAGSCTQNEYQPWKLPPVPVNGNTILRKTIPDDDNADKKTGSGSLVTPKTENTMKVKPQVKPKPNLKATATVGRQQPFVNVPTSGGETTKSQHNPIKKKEIKTLSDIPDDLTELSVEQVADCLKLLHLDKFKESFREQQVDGVLLVSLDIDTLIDCFQMPKFEAQKLEMFYTKNWRPKIE